MGDEICEMEFKMDSNGIQPLPLPLGTISAFFLDTTSVIFSCIFLSQLNPNLSSNNTIFFSQKLRITLHKAEIVPFL